MQFSVKILFLLFIFSITICAQDKSRPQQIEELKKLTSQLEQIQNQIKQIEEQRDEIALQLLRATEKDREEAERIGAKAVRLFPDGIMDNLFYAPDEVGFSLYSFTEISDYYFAPRIEYKKGLLEFVKEEGNLGFIANIGGIPLETIDEQSREVIALAKYKPPSDFKDAKSDYVSNNLTFRNSVSVEVGMTYLARVLRYGEGDAIFALKVHRKDTDGSIILFIKVIKTFEPPQVKNVTSTEQIQNQQNSSGISNYETAQKVQNAMLQKGFYDVTVDISTTPITLRGTVPKGKLAEAVQAAQEANGGKPVRIELTEK